MNQRNVQNEKPKKMKTNKTKTMKKLIFLIVLALGLVTQLAAQNMSVDYVVLDATAPNLAQLQAQYNGQSNVFFNESPKPAPYLIPAMMENHPAVDLHIFVAAQPGLLMFGSGTINSVNAENFSQYFSTWKNNVSGKVIIHNAGIFTTSAGVALKAKLEELTSLVFTTQ
jgi:hypothetical protein